VSVLAQLSLSMFHMDSLSTLLSYFLKNDQVLNPKRQICLVRPNFFEIAITRSVCVRFGSIFLPVLTVPWGSPPRIRTYPKPESKETKGGTAGPLLVPQYLSFNDLGRPSPVRFWG
jgi:hypothetical protein